MKHTSEEIKNIDVLHCSIDPDGELIDNYVIVDTLLQRIKELESPVLPDDVAEAIRVCRCDYETALGYSRAARAAADLLERQQREILGLERINLELAIDSQVPDLLEHIEQLEATVEAFRENRAGQYLKRIEQLEARVKELGAIPRDEADGFNKIIAHYQQQVARLEREIRKLKHRPSIASFNALQEECDGRMVAIKKLQQQQGDFNIAILQRDAARKRIEELEAELNKLESKNGT